MSIASCKQQASKHKTLMTSNKHGSAISIVDLRFADPCLFCSLFIRHSTAAVSLLTTTTSTDKTRSWSSMC